MAADTIDAFHAQLVPASREICEALQAALNAGLHGAEAKIWHRHPVWFYDRNPIAGYSQLKACVRLMFWSGQSFPTPGLAPSGSFKAAELRLTAPDQIDAEAIDAWCADARRFQWDYANIVRRKGRLEKRVWPEGSS